MHSRPFCLFSYLFCAGTDPAHWLECSSLLSATFLWRKRKLAPSCQVLVGMPVAICCLAFLIPEHSHPAYPRQPPLTALVQPSVCIPWAHSVIFVCTDRSNVFWGLNYDFGMLIFPFCGKNRQDLLTFVKHLRTWLKNMKWPQNIVTEYPYKDIFLHDYVLRNQHI